jgi:hypothetical protein
LYGQLASLYASGIKYILNHAIEMGILLVDYVQQLKTPWFDDITTISYSLDSTTHIGQRRP